jgi:hypothetical protein
VLKPFASPTRAGKRGTRDPAIGGGPTRVRPGATRQHPHPHHQQQQQQQQQQQP